MIKVGDCREYNGERKRYRHCFFATVPQYLTFRIFNLGNNIAVDPNIICHSIFAERNEDSDLFAIFVSEQK